MKINELNKMTFEKAVEALLEEDVCLTTAGTLKQYAIEQIRENDTWLAHHILSEMLERPNDEDIYYYDYTLGTYMRPYRVSDLIDLERFCEDYKEYYQKKAAWEKSLLEKRA